MCCEKCGNELPENETVCPCCEEQPQEAIEELLADTSDEMQQEPICQQEDFVLPTMQVIRKKRGLARVIIGIVALVMAVALCAVAFVNPVLIIGKWKMNQTMPTGMGTELKIESTMTFTSGGKLILTDSLLNWEELGYPEDQSSFINEFSYYMQNGNLMLNAISTEEEAAQTSGPIEMHCDVTPNQFSYWQGDTIPREVYDYQRDGLFYPSMYLWLASAVCLILGVLLVAIPGKKQTVTLAEEAVELEEAEDLDEFLEEIYEEIEAVDGILEEVTEAAEETATEENADETAEVTE